MGGTHSERSGGNINETRGSAAGGVSSDWLSGIPYSSEATRQRTYARDKERRLTVERRRRNCKGNVWRLVFGILSPAPTVQRFCDLLKEHNHDNGAVCFVHGLFFISKIREMSLQRFSVRGERTTHMDSCGSLFFLVCCE